jgi:glycosyltransferase involved in cell wall biosynthesis
MMRRNFALDSVIIPMPCAGPDTGAKTRPKSVSNGVLWAGRLCAQKRPDKLMKIAKAMPALQFDMVGRDSGDRCAQSALAMAARLSNVCVHGQVPPHAMPSFYENAACLLCTSDYEGFPNTFLEAWSYALPVISTFDPDGLIARHQLGAVASDEKELCSALAQLMSSASLYREASEKGLCYYRQNHSADRVLPQFERLFAEAAGFSAGTQALQPIE